MSFQKQKYMANISDKLFIMMKYYREVTFGYKKTNLKNQNQNTLRALGAQLQRIHYNAVNFQHKAVKIWRWFSTRQLSHFWVLVALLRGKQEAILEKKTLESEKNTLGEWANLWELSMAIKQPNHMKTVKDQCVQFNTHAHWLTCHGSKA